MTQVIKDHSLGNIIQKALNSLQPQQGIIGIHIPTDLGVVEDYELKMDLFDTVDNVNYEIQVIVLPQPSAKHFSVSNSMQMEALKRRVERDKIDGIRYNRLYLAVYTECPPSSVIETHTIWIATHKEHFEFVGTIKDYREPKESKLLGFDPGALKVSVLSQTPKGYIKTAEITALSITRGNGEPMYLHADLNSKGEAVLKDQNGNELNPSAEDLIPRPVDLSDQTNNADKVVFGNSMKGVIAQVLEDKPISDVDRVATILFSRSSLIKRLECIDPTILIPPSMGTILKTAFGFDQADSHIQLAEMLGYSEVVAQGILNDKYESLLTIHLIDISRILDIDFETLNQAYLDYVAYRDRTEQ